MFGTDGIRGRFGEEPLTAQRIETLSTYLSQRYGPNAKFVVGWDSRKSSLQVVQWICSAFQPEQCILLGMIPTPVVAFETRERAADLGIMVTASHNPWPDNGLKFFQTDGTKLPHHTANEWSEAVTKTHRNFTNQPKGPLPGMVAPVHYIEFLKQHFASLTTSTLKVGFDLAHGAASSHIPQWLSWLLPTAHLHAHAPNGTNINDQCGALFAETSAKQCGTPYDYFFALDGDGDRLVVCDRQGRAFHGDHILMALMEMHQRTASPVPALVSTILAGLGLEQALAKKGISLIRTPVGDQNVLEALLRENLPIGGEPSGHFINTTLLPSGDGFLTALSLLKALRETPNLLEEQRQMVPIFPQVDKAYPVRHKPPLDTLDPIQSAHRALEEALGDNGRLILRYSGTEKKIRLFVEATSLDAVQPQIASLEAAIGSCLQ
jgi:phosphoglucosamine mutase